MRGIRRASELSILSLETLDPEHKSDPRVAFFDKSLADADLTRWPVVMLGGPAVAFVVAVGITWGAGKATGTYEKVDKPDRLTPAARAYLGQE